MQSPQERFEAKFERITESGCWIWTGAIFPARGYGAFAGNGEQLAHRFAWSLYVGPIPAGKHVLHRCDVPACVNPGHLFLGDQRSNMADKVAKRRQAKGRDFARAKLTEEQVLEIRRAPQPQTVIAAKYGIHQGTVSGIKTRKIWKHIP